MLWLRYQDSNGCGLLEVHEAVDWADLLANRFNVPVLQIPLLPHEVKGLDLLTKLADKVYGAAITY